jgi:hypothetical protein
MDYKRGFNRGQWFQKTLIFLFFSMFTAKAQAQLSLPGPVNSVQPVGISVQKRGTEAGDASFPAILRAGQPVHTTPVA